MNINHIENRINWIKRSADELSTLMDFILNTDYMKGTLHGKNPTSEAELKIVEQRYLTTQPDLAKLDSIISLLDQIEDIIKS